MTKSCTKCKQQLSLDNFHQYKSGPRKGKYWSHCKGCRRKGLYEWRKNNPAQYKDHYRRARYKYKYGLESHEIKSFGECPICQKEKRLVADHCHTQNKFRGFICYNCNTVLGHIENKEKFERFSQWIISDGNHNDT